MDRIEMINILSAGPVRIHMMSKNTVEISSINKPSVSDTAITYLCECEDGKLRHACISLRSICSIEMLDPSEQQS